MKFYMSYWSGGYLKKPEPYLINYHKLCAHYIIQNHGEVHLITDSNAKKCFKDIPYTTVTTELDSLSSNLNWALGKLYTYKKLSQQGDPFLHVDYDVFAKQPFPESKLSSSVLVQSTEMILPPDRWNDMDTFYKYCPNKGYCNRDDVNDISYNTGIFGGNDLEFINKYATSAFDLSIDPANQDGYAKMNQNGECWYLPTIFLEQYYLYQCSKKFNVGITTLLRGGDYDSYWFDYDMRQLEYVHINDLKDRNGYKAFKEKGHNKIVQLVNRKLKEAGIEIA